MTFQMYNYQQDEAYEIKLTPDDLFTYTDNRQQKFLMSLYPKSLI